MTAHSSVLIPDSRLLAPFDGRVVVSGDANYPFLSIDTPQAKATLALHGAQMLSFQPKGQEDLLWTSRSAIYRPGVAIRGGIPICWPWFGPGQPLGQSQAHGFARNQFWTLDSIVERADQSIELTLSLAANEHSRALWPHAFALSLTVVVGASLSLELRMRNTGSEPQQITAALHTYLRVSDIARVAVRGLEHTRYIDKLAGDRIASSPDPIRFSAEMDRVYLATEAEVQVDDPGWGRVLKVAKAGSRSTVVWNPWSEKSSKMADFDRGAYPSMLCIEAANAADDVITLGAGQEHCLATAIDCCPLN